jgi:acyl-CoA dehydrogenase
VSHLDLPLLDDSHRRLAADIGAWASKHVADGEPADPYAESRRLVEALADGGWLKLGLPAPAGARDRLDVRSLCVARETLAYRSALADFAFAMQGLGAGPISLFGTDEQKGRYLPDVAAGRSIMAFALSEAEAGSDVANLSTSARPDDGDWILDGEKTWISNAGLADIYVVFARTGEPGAKGISAFIVPAGAAGLEFVGRIDTPSPHPLGSIRLDGCRVPADAMLATPGAGFRVAMATLDVFRTTVGAAALGLARRALDETLAHVRSRMLFGGPMSALPGVQARIAEMATDVEAAALLVYRAAWTKDAGTERVTKEAAMAKTFATEAAGRGIDAAVQLHGGRGVTSGHVVERLTRDIRPLRIYEGATEVLGFVVGRAVLRGD